MISNGYFIPIVVTILIHPVIWFSELKHYLSCAVVNSTFTHSISNTSVYGNAIEYYSYRVPNLIKHLLKENYGGIAD